MTERLHFHFVKISRMKDIRAVVLNLGEVGDHTLICDGSDKTSDLSSAKHTAADSFRA